MCEPLARRIAAAGAAGRFIATSDGVLDLAEALGTTRLSVDPAGLRDRSVVLLTRDALNAAASLIELDGLARRIVLCPPDFDLRSLAAVVRDAEADAIVTEEPLEDAPAAVVVACGQPPRPTAPAPGRDVATEWALMTSGTTGDPKMAVHTLATLTSAINPSRGQRWATFYDIRRYGGLQILLRALSGDGSLTLPGRDEPVDTFLTRCGEAGVTHISGTPSHWRKALMSPAATRLAAGYIRLSGEIADSAVLDALRRFYRQAQIAHAYASTEAGVGFAVDDGLAGFPAAWLAAPPPGVALRIVDDALHLRGPGRALFYLGSAAAPIADAEGFVDTGDLVERRGNRFLFVGRRNGIINVGGAKVHPEEVEAVINRQAGVRASLVKARRNPITGALVAADVVLEPGVGASEALRAAILAGCRAALPAHKAPAHISFVPTLAMTAGGKLARHG